MLSFAFAADRKTLASASHDLTIRLWNLSDYSAEPIVLHGHEDLVLSVSFSLDSQTLVSASNDKTVRLWRMLDELMDMGCQQVTRNLSWEEWQRYVGSQVAYEKTCRNWPVHPSVPEGERPSS